MMLSHLSLRYFVFWINANSCNMGFLYVSFIFKLIITQDDETLSKLCHYSLSHILKGRMECLIRKEMLYSNKTIKHGTWEMKLKNILLILSLSLTWVSNWSMACFHYFWPTQISVCMSTKFLVLVYSGQLWLD
jgi:hypothetical protein